MYKEAVSSVRATRHENRRLNSAIYFFKFLNHISTYYNRLISHLNIENFACDCEPTWEAFDTRRSLANSTTFSCVVTWRQHSQKQYVNKFLHCNKLALIVTSLFMHALSQPSVVTAFKYVYGWSNAPWRWWINYCLSVGNSELGAGVFYCALSTMTLWCWHLQRWLTVDLYNILV